MRRGLRLQMLPPLLAAVSRRLPRSPPLPVLVHPAHRRHLRGLLLVLLIPLGLCFCLSLHLWLLCFWLCMSLLLLLLRLRLRCLPLPGECGSQQAVDDDVRVAPDGGGEVRVHRLAQGVVAPLGRC